MARHKQKDEEAGAEGRGILNTRKNPHKLISCVRLQTDLKKRQAYVERYRRKDRDEEAGYCE